MSQIRSAPSSLFFSKKEGLGALSYGTPILRHSHSMISDFSLFSELSEFSRLSEFSEFSVLSEFSEFSGFSEFYQVLFFYENLNSEFS